MQQSSKGLIAGITDLGFEFFWGSVKSNFDFFGRPKAKHPLIETPNYTHFHLPSVICYYSVISLSHIITASTCLIRTLFILLWSSIMATQNALSECVTKLRECSICFEQMSLPKVLPCQHTFCLNCLTKTVDSIMKKIQ